MAFKFNPFTGTLDQTGSGGGASYIDGEVQNFSALPETIGTPAVDSAYLVREAEGTWLLARKPAGIYIRTADTGVRAADWTHASAFPDVFSDAAFTVYSDGDSTKNLQLSLSGLTTGTTRTLTAPDASGTIARTEDFAAPPAIGSTTPNSAAFTTLSANNGTLTASAPVLDLSQTWNNAAVTFTGLLANFTNTASAAASLLADFQVGATSQFKIDKTGNVTVPASAGYTAGLGRWYDNGAGGFVASLSGLDKIRMLPSLDYFIFSATTALTWGSSGVSGVDLIVARDAADTLAQRRTTNPQTFRIYNTYTDASNYERGFMRWTSNVLQIGTEKGGTGSVRTIGINVGSIEAIAIATNGEVTVRSRIYISTGSKDVAYTGLGSHAFPSVGTFSIRPWSGSACRINIGGDTSSFPALKRDSTAIHVRLADDSAFAPLSCGALTLNGNLDASTRDLVTDTTTGTKIGTATTQKLGFFNATPVVQQAAVADATDAATAITQLNDLLAAMRTLGLIAT
jgi:hypothetical protein